MSNPNFDSLVTTTFQNYRSQLTDNVTGHNALWWMLKKMPGGIEERDGGRSIVEPLMIARNSTVKSYKGYDILDMTPQSGFSAAEYDWKQIAGTISISGEEEFKNSGKSQIINLLKSKAMQLEMSLELELNRMIQGDGTGTGGKDITGLALQVEDGAAWSTVGGIDSNANPYWRNQWIGGTAAFSSVGVDRMRTLFNSCSRGNSRPGIILTDQYLFEAYEKTLTVNERFTNMEMGDAGFQNLLYKGVPITFDEDMPFEDLATDEHQILMLNLNFIKFVVGKGRNFAVTPLVKPDNQDAKSSSTILYGNLVCNNRARQGRATDLT